MDNNGEPLVVYHGGNKDLEGKPLTQFNSDRLIFATTNIKVAQYFGDYHEYFMNIKNPFIIDDGYNLWERIDEDFLIKKLGKDTFIKIVNNEYKENFSYEEWLKYTHEVEALIISIDAVSNYIKYNTNYDGVIAYDIEETTEHIKADDYICFKSNQIKYANGNKTFDIKSSDVRY